jgi:Flp pilus assembly secretin CpaC/tetratricopeptide (TPR) repeat protein
MKLNRVFLFFAITSVGFSEEPLVGSVMEQEAVAVGERRVRAENDFETALLLYRQQNYQQAALYFKSALKLNPKHQEAEEYLVRVQAVLGSGVLGEASVHGNWLQQHAEVRHQEQRAQYRLSLEESDRAYQSLSNSDDQSLSDRLSALLEVTALYQKSYDMAKALEGGEDRRTAMAYVKERMRELGEREIRLRSLVQASMREDAKKLIAKERLDSDAYFANKVNAMLSAAKSDFERENFDACLDLCEDVMLVDPKNSEAKKLMKKTVEARHEKVELDTQFENNKERSRRLLKVKEQFVPYASSVVYPSDWDTVDARKKTDSGEVQVEAWKTSLEGKLEQRLSYSCPGLPLTEVLTQLSDLSGLNIVLSQRVLQERDSMELDIEAFDFGHMKLKNIIQWICRQVDMSFVLKYDVVFLTEKSSAVESLQVRLYDIQDLIAVRQMVDPPSLEDGFVQDLEEDIQLEADDLDGEEPLSADRILEMIQESIVGNWDEGNVLIEALDTGMLFVVNSPDVHRQVEAFLETFRETTSLQIEVEARRIRINKGFVRELGVDWKGLDSGAPMSNGTAPGYVNRSGSSVIKAAVNNGFSSGVPSLSGVGFFMEHSILGAFQAKVLINAIESDVDTTTLISPRIVMENNVMGYIRLGSTVSYVASYQNNEGALQPVVSKLDRGELLAVTPTVSSDRRYITLKVQPDFQDVELNKTLTLTGTTTLSGPNGVTQTSYSLPLQLPKITKTRVRTVAVIPDGGVLILGGLSDSNESQRSRGVPLLSKIPFLGRLFRSDGNQEQSTDDMLMVHGTIIVFDEMEANL